MIRSFGDSVFPVAQAGQASWQRPHSVHEKPSSISFQVRSASVPAPKRISLVRLRRSAAARAGRAAACRANKTFTAAVAMCRCFECGEVGEEAEDHAECAQTKTRSSAWRRRCRTGARARSTPGRARPATRSGRRRSAPRASRGASGRRPRSSPGSASASPRWRALEARRPQELADDDRGRDPDEHEHREQVDEATNQPWCPSHGRVASWSTAAIIAITIVGKRTRKPQKMNACISPGTRRCSSFRWPSTSAASFRTRRGTSPERSTGLPRADEPRTGSGARRAKSPPRDGEQRGERRARPPATAMRRAFLSSARDRRHDLVQVADHRVVGARQDRRLRRRS